MFVDFPEVVIIFGVALVVLGPKKLPGAAKQVGRWVGRARGMARQFREQLEEEVNNVDSALDPNLKRSERAKSVAPPGSSAEASQGENGHPTEMANGAEGETDVGSASDMDVSATDWNAPYEEEEESLAPYGDPNAIPEPDAAADGQLSLELDPPGQRVTPRPPSEAPRPEEAASPAHSADETEHR